MRGRCRAQRQGLVRTFALRPSLFHCPPRLPLLHVRHHSLLTLTQPLLLHALLFPLFAQAIQVALGPCRVEYLRDRW